jgi:catechol 2,3-dioxygenase-like lactoylglutathione lyase family enzyme
MTNGGAARLYVSDVQRAVKFYTEILGLRLRAGYQDRWASIDAGNGFILGLHAASARIVRRLGKAARFPWALKSSNLSRAWSLGWRIGACSFAVQSRKTPELGFAWFFLATRTGTISTFAKRAHPGESSDGIGFISRSPRQGIMAIALHARGSTQTKTTTSSRSSCRSRTTRPNSESVSLSWQVIRMPMNTKLRVGNLI